MIRSWLMAGGLVLFFSTYATTSFAQTSEQCVQRGLISCVELAIGISKVDDQNDQNNVQFDDLGALLEALQNETTFNTLNSALEAVSGISFDSVNEFFDALNKCGLVAFLVNEIED